MGASLCKEQADTRPKVRDLTIWGDYTNADTRAILAVLKITGQKYHFEQLNTLNNEHETDKRFVVISPNKEVPVITEGSYIIISGPVQFMTYLTSTREDVKKKLYPEDCHKQIHKHINWFQDKMRPATGRLMKMLNKSIKDLAKDNNSENSQSNI